MAYATKYLFKWESVNGTTREIRVLLDGYSGSVIQRRLGRAPVLKKQHNGNVYGTSLEFYAECTVDGEFAEFYTTDPKAYRVDLYSGNTLLWQGYITPELYAEPDIAPPYDVQVIATDGVGELKLYDFAPQGLVSLRSMLTYLLGYTGLTTDVYLISSIKPGGSGAAGSLLEKTINLDYMAGKSCYEVLSYILDTLHATITWWKGAWILARETNVKFSSGKVQYFNTSGNAGTLAGSVVALGKLYTNDAWPVGQLSSKIDPAKNSVRIQAPWHPVTALSNPGMTSDTGWTKAGGAVYDSTNKGYHLPEASLSAIPRISQTLSLSSLKNPMTLAAKVTGVSADLSLSTLFTAAMGFYVTYEVSGTTYHLERSDEGLVWKQGAMPSLLNYTNTIFTFLKTFDEDRTGAQTVDIEIPPFLLNNAFPAGTLAVYVFGGCVRVYGASLDVIISKGYQDNLYLDNDARGEGDEVEIAIGRETSAISPYQAFLQGILLDSGSLITSFKDDYITSSGLDFMSFIARDYARSFALPRIVQTGTVSLESSVTFPPLVFTKGALDYWLEGYSWNMLDDELDISARSLPTATITVESETVTEAGGTASSAAQGGSSSGGGSMPSGVNYFEQDDDQQELIKLKAAYSYLGPKKGLIFDSVLENDSSDADLYVKWVGEGTNRQRVLYSPLALITDGDQIVGSGTPGGGGGGGVSHIYELLDFTDAITDRPTSGDKLLIYSTATGVKGKDGTNGAWTYIDKSSVGRIYTGGTGITISNTNEISVTANTYQPLDADLTAIAGLSGTSGLLKKTAANTWTLDTSAYITGITSTMVTTALGYTPVPDTRTINSKALSADITLSLDDVADGSSRKLADYLPLNLGSGKTISGTGDTPLAINTTGNCNALDFHIGGTRVGNLQFYDSSFTYGVVIQNFTASGAPYVNLASDGEFKYKNTYPFLHSNNYSSYALPLTGGTISATGAVSLYVNSTYASQTAINIQRNGTSKGQIGVWDSHGLALYEYTTGGYIYISNTNGKLYKDGGYEFYHSGNSNSASVAWSCSTLNAASYIVAGETGVAQSLFIRRAYDGSTSYWIGSVGGTGADSYTMRIRNGSGIYGSSIDLADALVSITGGFRVSGNIIIGPSTVENGRFKIVGATQDSTANALYVCNSGGTTILSARNDNRVGIYTSSPAYTLDVNGMAFIAGYLLLGKGGNTIDCYNSAQTSTYNLHLQYYSSGGITLCNGGGNVMIGSSSPNANYKLYVDGAARAASLTLAGALTGATSISASGSARIGNSTTTLSSDTGYFIDNGSRNISLLYGTSGKMGIYHSATGWMYYIDTDNSLILNGNHKVVGTLTTTGDQSISSDIIWKTNLQPVKYTIEDIAKCRAVTFDWKDGRGKSAGSIAQDWKPLIPELVHGEEGNMTLAYGQIALVNSILLAKHETEQDKEIHELREALGKANIRMGDLENEIEMLRRN